MKRQIRKLVEKIGNIAGFQLENDGKRTVFLKHCFKQISHLEGDVVECGLGKLRTFSLLARLVFSEGKSRRIWGFDSFEGFPEPSLEDVKGSHGPKKGDWMVLREENVEPILLSRGIPGTFIRNHVIIRPGFFSQSLPAAAVDRIALLHLDVDLYSSYADCLRLLYPKVVPGGVIAFDEYDSVSDQKKWPGAKRAVDEFAYEQGIILKKEFFSRKAYLIK